MMRVLIAAIMDAAGLAVFGRSSEVAASTTSTSAEITRWYVDGLNRQPDSGGRAYWVSVALERSDQSFSFASRAFHLSPEFLQNNPTWTSRVTRMYESILDRSPDSGGLNYWVNRLNSGTSWNTVVSRFAYSPEAMARYRSIIASDCGVNSTIPWRQRYNQVRNDMTRERARTFSLERDNRLGILVADLWIRGPQRQVMTPWINTTLPGINLPTSARMELGVDSDRGPSRTFAPTDSRGILV